MNEKNNSEPFFNPENKIDILLAEYQAIEQMHIHFDVLNMSITAIITAGVLALWGIIIQTAFQENLPINNLVFVNSVSILSLAIIAILSVWIRYTTIHRCIVIKKLTRSHEIESILHMRQNTIFRYNANSLKAPLDSDDAKRRPGGHTLELFLYISLSAIGIILSLCYQAHIFSSWNIINYLIIGFQLLALIAVLLWTSFCKFDVVTTIKGQVEVGLPWNLFFLITKPLNSFLRRIINFKPMKF